MQRSICIAVGILAITLVPAGAHQGWGGNADEEFKLTGTVEQSVRLAGPHATMKLRSDGKVWDLTLAPPARTERAGLKDGAIPVGAQISIEGHRNRDSKRLEVAVRLEMVRWNRRLAT